MKQFLKRVLPQSLVRRIQQYRFQQRVARFQPYIIKKREGEVVFNFWIADPIAQYWYDRDDVGLWREMEFIRDMMLHPGDRVFECGAHHGYTTLLLSKWVGETGKVLAFEASAHNYHILQKNIALNHLVNVQAYNAAVGEKQGKIHISIDYNVNVLPSAAGKPVDMVSLDAFKAENPTLLKIDVEGFEEAVLRGAQEILKQKPKLAIEVHTEWLQKYNSSVSKLLEQINLANYDIWIQWDEEAKPQRYQREEILRRVHLFFLPMETF